MARALVNSSVPIAFILCLFLLNLSPFWDLRSLGIEPRSFSGLLGVLLAPFLHASFSHLMSNLMPLWVLLFILATFYPQSYWLVFWMVLIASGMMTWLVGSSNGVHIGASGIVFALAAFIGISGFLRKRLLLIVVGCLVVFFYHYLLGGLLPTGGVQSFNISYSSHWSGLLAGFFIALFLAYQEKKRTI